MLQRLLERGIKSGLNKKQQSELHWSLRRQGMNKKQAYRTVNTATALSKKYHHSKWKDGKMKAEHAYYDYDGDGKVNKYDCRPFDKYRQDENPQGFSQEKLTQELNASKERAFIKQMNPEFAQMSPEKQMELLTAHNRMQELADEYEEKTKNMPRPYAPMERSMTEYDKRLPASGKHKDAWTTQLGQPLFDKDSKEIEKELKLQSGLINPIKRVKEDFTLWGKEKEPTKGMVLPYQLSEYDIKKTLKDSPIKNIYIKDPLGQEEDKLVDKHKKGLDDFWRQAETRTQMMHTREKGVSDARSAYFNKEKSNFLKEFHPEHSEWFRMNDKTRDELFTELEKKEDKPFVLDGFTYDKKTGETKSKVNAMIGEGKATRKYFADRAKRKSFEGYDRTLTKVPTKEYIIQQREDMMPADSRKEAEVGQKWYPDPVDTEQLWRKQTYFNYPEQKQDIFRPTHYKETLTIPKGTTFTKKKEYAPTGLNKNKYLRRARSLLRTKKASIWAAEIRPENVKKEGWKPISKRMNDRKEYLQTKPKKEWLNIWQTKALERFSKGFGKHTHRRLEPFNSEEYLEKMRKKFTPAKKPQPHHETRQAAAVREYGERLALKSYQEIARRQQRRFDEALAKKAIGAFGEKAFNIAGKDVMKNL